MRRVSPVGKGAVRLEAENGSKTGVASGGGVGQTAQKWVERQSDPLGRGDGEKQVVLEKGAKSISNNLCIGY